LKRTTGYMTVDTTAMRAQAKSLKPNVLVLTPEGYACVRYRSRRLPLCSVAQTDRAAAGASKRVGLVDRSSV
jgi:hypothetical protein